MITQEQVVAGLPSHLRPFVALQDYSQYTPRDQAVWRFLLTQLKHNLSKSAQPTYVEGLRRTGINTESIPRIEEINSHLNKLGWQAVVVDGFLPPAIFMEFQAIRVLVIAVNIRSFEHMLYTPAPDIVHESAGHAPFLIDIDYAEFLQRFGELGMRAIANQADMDVYEAIRNLSIIKETAGAAQADIQAAELQLEHAQATNSVASESALLARLHWWTVEYGLVGSTDNYYIYGAGLLSSLGESVHCLDDERVTKYPLTVDVINQGYDITTEQPQLFVTESCRHLSQVLEEFGRHMCCHRGGTSALQEVIEAATVNTARLNSGLQVAGKFSRLITDAVGNPIYFNTDGPTQLAYQNEQLPNHSTDYHAQGFGSPLGRLRGFERCLSSYSVDELIRHNIELDKNAELNFLSGVRVQGKLVGLLRRDQKNILLSFEGCTVTNAKGDVLFDPTWGTFDMAVGDSVVSVTGGSADSHAYPLYQVPSNKTTITQQYDYVTKTMFEWYQRVRSLREQSESSPQQVSDAQSLVDEISSLNEPDWLLLHEVLELVHKFDLGESRKADLTQRLQKMQKSASEDVQNLIQYGLDRF